jgi:hypothetical protein
VCASAVSAVCVYRPSEASSALTNNNVNKDYTCTSALDAYARISSMPAVVAATTLLFVQHTVCHTHCL